MKTIDEILIDLYNHGFAVGNIDSIGANGQKIITQAKSDIVGLVEGLRKVNSWAESKSDGEPLVSLGYNQAIDDVVVLFKKEV